MRTLTALFASSLVLVLVADVALAQKKKLFRWTDETGKVHYTDQLPPEAASAAHDQLNREGRAVDRVERALTPEERAAYDAEQARLTELQRLADEKAKMDTVLMASYPTEADLARSYKERFDLLQRSVESAEIGIRNQDKSLTDLLAHAATLERNGNPVPDTVVESITKTRKQVVDQGAFLAQREAERGELQKEYDAILARYRGLASASSSGSAAAVTNTSTDTASIEN